MDSFFKDKVYIVTGGGAGIGLAIARQLAEQGAYSYALDIHKEPTDEFSATTHELLIYDCCDVRDRQRCHEVTSSIIEKHGRLDGLVNNAAVTLIEGELPDDEIFQTTYDINVKGVWNMGTEALVQMRGQANGAIVNIASTSARNGVPRLPVYSSTKHAVLGLTRTWALDFAKYQVRVNCIAPGVLNLSIPTYESQSDSAKDPPTQQWDAVRFKQ